MLFSYVYLNKVILAIVHSSYFTLIEDVIMIHNLVTISYPKFSNTMNNVFQCSHFTTHVMGKVNHIINLDTEYSGRYMMCLNCCNFKADL